MHKYKIQCFCWVLYKPLICTLRQQTFLLYSWFSWMSSEFISMNAVGGTTICRQLLNASSKQIYPACQQAIGFITRIYCGLFYCFLIQITVSVRAYLDPVVHDPWFQTNGHTKINLNDMFFSRLECKALIAHNFITTGESQRPNEILLLYLFFFFLIAQREVA